MVLKYKTSEDVQKYTLKNNKNFYYYRRVDVDEWFCAGLYRNRFKGLYFWNNKKIENVLSGIQISI